ncbi:MAG: cupin domain-containing protein [Acidobacteriaceae bacterium]|nr:cupin domain-containing protein [Acidobacteriaceae bacterium]
MLFSRRDLAPLLSMLGIENAAPQEIKPRPVLTGKLYNLNSLAVRASADGSSKAVSFFNGVTTRGQHLSVHMTQLAPGKEPHPPSRQPHEEIIIVTEGTLEVTINGQTSTAAPGSVLYSAYNDLKGWKNVGSSPARYYVVALEEHS